MVKLEGELATAAQEAGQTHALRAELEALKSPIEQMLMHLPPGKVPDARQILISLSALDAEVARRRDEQEALARDIEALRRIEATSRAIEAKGLSGLELQKTKQAEKCEAALAESRDLGVLRRESAQLQSELKEAHRRNREVRDQYQACARAAGGGKAGDRVACWKDAGNRIEYVFEVQLSGKGLQVARRWSNESGGDGSLRQGPGDGGSDRVGGRVPGQYPRHLPGFGGEGLPIYVVITGTRSAMDPTRFREFQRVQEHFYIYDNVR